MSNINVNNLTPLLGSGSSVSVSGSLVVKNDVTIGGHLYIGDANTDSVTFSAEVSSSILPDANITYDLGSASKQWREVFLNSLVVKHITASGNISASGTGVNGTGSFHHLYSNGNIHATGTGSFDQAVIASNSSSFTYVSMSGALDTSYHVSASRILIHGGNNATGSVGTAPSLEVRATASIGYISASGDMTMSGTASFGGGIDALGASGSFQYVNVTDNISGSASGSFMDVFINDNLEVQGVTNLHGNISSSNGVTASFGYLSSSGDIMANTPGVTASLTHVSASEVRGTSGSFTVLAIGRDIPNGTGTEYTTPTRPIDIRADEHNQLIRLDSTINGGDCTINYRNSFGTDVNWAAGLDGGDNSFRITKTTEFSSVASDDYFIISANADVSSSGRVSASGGFETDAGTTSNFGNISSSGNLIISGHVSASRVSASHGFEADTASTSSFGHISASGNAIFGNSTVVISGSAGEITSSGNISSSATIFATQYYVGSTGALIALAGNKTLNQVKLGGAASVTQIHGLSIDVTGSVSMSGDISMSAAHGLEIDSGNIVTNTGEIHAGGQISSSEQITANTYVGQHNGAQVFSVSNTGAVAAEGAVSASSTLAGTALTLATNGVNALTVSTAGALSASSTLAGTALTLGDDGINTLTIDTKGHVSASGTGSFVSLNVTDAGVAKFNVDTNGHVSASGKISSSQDLHGTHLTLATNGVPALTVAADGDLTTTGIISSSNGSPSIFRAISLKTNGESVIDLVANGVISASGVVQGTALKAQTNGDTKFVVDASGNLSSSGTLAGTALDIRTDGVQKAVIDANGTGSFFGGIDSPGATGSFGFISCSGDISGTANIHLGSQIIGPGNIAQLEMSATNLSLGHSNTITGLSGTQLNLNATTNGITVTGSISASHAFDTVGSGSFGGGLTSTGNIHSTGQVYAPFYRNYHAVTNDQVLTTTSSGVPIVCTNDVAVTLPAVAIGVSFWIVNGNADGTKITISPDANDKFLINAAGATGTDDKDCINTAATSRKGDYLKITYGSADGWTILERAGVWADQS